MASNLCCEAKLVSLLAARAPRSDVIPLGKIVPTGLVYFPDDLIYVLAAQHETFPAIEAN